MSDKSLPKPVPPRDSAPTGSNAKPVFQSSPPDVSSNDTPQISKPAPSDKPLATPPPSMKPPSAMGKPPSLPGAPPQSIPKSAASGLPPRQTPPTGSVKPADASKKAADNNKPKSKFANVKQSPFKFLPFIVGGLVLVGIIWFVITKIGGGNNTSPTTSPKDDGASTQAPARKTVPAEQTSLIYWGLWEPDTTIRSVLDKFEAANPGVKVSYVKQSHQDYRERLQTAIASGNGPDLFRYHASWVPMLAEELSTLPQSVMSASEYQQTFYPIAAKMLNIDGQIVGIPLMYDSLGLYLNTDMLEAANSSAPTTWAEVKILAKKLTVKDGNNIKRGGMAIGNASNVEHFADILGLLMLQNGADLSVPDSKEAQDALSFYTNFVKEDEVWDSKLPSSTVAFARGDAAMMLAPSWRAHEVLATNPDLNFKISPVPRLGSTDIAWATFWAEGVSDKSKNKTKAWELLKYLSSSEVQQELYSAQSQVRNFGEIYSRVELAEKLAAADLALPFLINAQDAAGWYLNSYTHDNGLNDLLIKYYQDAINVVLDGETAAKALETVAKGTQQVLRQYGVE